MENAEQILALWGLDAACDVKLINISENLTYKIEPPNGAPYILRAHRLGYHSPAAIQSELAWASALQTDNIIETPRAIAGVNGNLLQEFDGRHYVLFDFIEGNTPNETEDLVTKFHALGKIAAKTHLHSITWQRPNGFTRLRWDLDAILGAHPIWGKWQDGPNVTTDIAKTLNLAEANCRDQITQYGLGKSRFGLIHADMRLANLLVHGSDVRLIDFDDCGFGWFMYDFAAAVSFVETNAQLPEWKTAWLEGYETTRALTRHDYAIIDSMIMLRRLNLLGWIGSHMDATEPQEMAPFFASDTAQLAERYLNGMLTN